MSSPGSAKNFIVILRCEGEARASKDDDEKGTLGRSSFEAHSPSLVRTQDDRSGCIDLGFTEIGN